jgi:GTP cyclohydrolase II
MHHAQGEFDCTVWRDRSGGVHLALSHGRWTPTDEVLVRVHEPFTALDMLDTGAAGHSWPLPRALQALQAGAARCGRAAELHQDADALLPLLLPAGRVRPRRAPQMDLRTYGVGAQILRELGVRRMKLLGSPRRMPSMTGYGLEVTGFVAPERLFESKDLPCKVQTRARRRRTGRQRAAHRHRAGPLQRAHHQPAGRGLPGRTAAAGGRGTRHHALHGARRAGSAVALKAMADSGDYDALIALGCIIRGETYHFELVANESGAGVTRVSLDHQIPIANAILTVENEAQAWARVDDKGADAARVAVEMANLLEEIG